MKLAQTSMRAIAVAAIILLTGCGGSERPSRDSGVTKELTVTGGAAPGYVNDQTCAECHKKIYDSYQHVGMAQSFYRPDAKKVIEDFDDNQYFHEPSQRYFEMTERDGGYFFKRYQLDEQGKPINVFQRQVDWILGSGNHARTYLYQTEAGELYQLPIAWYSQSKSWRMAPGFDSFDQPGVRRRVERDCMFCHNAYPDVAAGTDMYGAPHIYPKHLTQGIGCQRCHGPGAEHVRVAREKDPAAKSLAASIVNPAKLEKDLSRDVCNQCHLQPSAALTGLRRFGRGDYSYRPGESLADYRVAMDLVEQGKDRAERFEKNHHSYRLEQSRCFLESKGTLGCTTCHDPHSKVSVDERLAHYRSACAKCHKTDDCQRQGADPAHLAADQANDCATCHMPKRRTQDFVHVVMTDHLIQRQPGGAELLASREESKPVVEAAEFLDSEHAPAAPLADIFRAAAVSRSTDGSYPPAVSRLSEAVEKLESPILEARLYLAEGQIKQRQFDDAKRNLKLVVERFPDSEIARRWLAIAHSSTGESDEAVDLLKSLDKEHPNSAEAHYNLALFLLAKSETKEAAAHLNRAIEIRPNMVMAWFYLGNAHAKLNQLEQAADSYRRALDIEPAHARVYEGLRDVLEQQGKTTEALRYWNHGRKITTHLRAQRLAAGSRRIDLLRVPKPQLDRLEASVARQIEAIQSDFDNVAPQQRSSQQLAAEFAELGQVYHAYQIYESAEACYINAIRLSPRDFRWPHLLADLYQQQGNLQKAIEQFQAAQRIRSDFIPTVIRLGNALLEHGEVDAAREQFQRVLDDQPDASSATYGMGEVAFRQNKFADAVQHFQKVLKLTPGANRVHYSLAMAYRELGELDKAKEHLAKQGKVGIRPADPLVDSLQELVKGARLHLLHGRRAFAAERYSEAVVAFGKAVKAEPDNVSAHVNLGTALVKVGDDDTAIEHYRTAAELAPENFAANYNLGFLLNVKKEYSKAITYLKAALKMRPKDIQANRQLSIALLEGGHAEEGIEQLRIVVQLDPADEDSLIALAEQLTKQKQYAEALKTLDSALKQFPDRIRTAHALAELLATASDPALRDGKRAVSLARQVYQVGKKPQQAETLAKALAEAGECEEAAVIQKQLLAEAKRLESKTLIERLSKALLRYEKGAPCRPPFEESVEDKPPAPEKPNPKNEKDESAKPPASRPDSPRP